MITEEAMKKIEFRVEEADFSLFQCAYELRQKGKRKKLSFEDWIQKVLHQEVELELIKNRCA